MNTTPNKAWLSIAAMRGYVSHADRCRQLREKTKKTHQEIKPMKNEKYLYSELTSKILESFYQVFNKVGKIIIDIFVDDKVLVKITNHDQIENRDAEILQNELRISEIEVGLLLNFGRRPEQKRRVNLTDNL